jgi:hypothetical protein
VRSRRVRRAGGLLLLAACQGSFLPLRGKIEVGKDPMVVFVGGDAPAGGDLYVVPAAGGPAIQITFTGVGEMRPALSPDGAELAFLRAGSLTDSMPESIWVLNLINGAERRIQVPKDAGPPEQVGWAQGDGGRSLVIRAGGQLYRAAAPPATGTAHVVSQLERAPAESALAVLLGNPAFARAVPCATPGDLCVVGDTGAPAVFARGAREPARWGDDSVGYLEGDRLVVRPLAAGHARQVEWSALPARPRQLTVFAGATVEPR